MNSPLSALKKGQRAGKNHYYGIMVFVLLMFEFIVFHPDIKSMNDMMTTLYLLSYQDIGFYSRFFIGSVFRVFFNYISTSALYFSICAIIICFNAFIAWVIGNILNRDEECGLSGLKIFVILFFTNPFSISFLYDYWNFGYSDIYHIGITIMMVLFLKNKYLKWLLPILGFSAIAVHPAWIFLYLPLVIIVLLYNCFVGNSRRSNVLLLGITGFVISISFIYFQFLSPVLEFETPGDMIAFLSKRTDLPLSFNYIMGNYFLPNFTFFYDSMQIIKSFAVPYSVVALIVTFPLLVVLFSFWVMALKKSTGKPIKFIITSCMISPLATLPVFVFFMDWDRWLCAVFIVQFSLAFYFIDSKLPCFNEAAKNIQAFFMKHFILFVFTIVFLATLQFSLARPLYYYLQKDMLGFFYEMFDKHIVSVS